MASNLPRHEGAEEENLLIEAVSLLVQRQRENEERSAALELRLSELEAQLHGLVHDVSPAVADDRLAALREQLEALRGEPGVRPVAQVSPTSLDARRQAPTLSAAPPRLEPVPPPAPALQDVSSPTPAAPPSTPAQAPSAWGVFGATPTARFSLLLIAVGVLALVYSAVLLLRFG